MPLSVNGQEMSLIGFDTGLGACLIVKISWQVFNVANIMNPRVLGDILILMSVDTLHEYNP